MSVMRIAKVNGERYAIPFTGVYDRECDVLVVGLGTAGAISAIAAARQGVSVIGVDSAPIPGGSGTSAFVWDYYYGANGGLYEEVNREADRILASGNYRPSTKKNYKISYPTAVKSLALTNKLREYGVMCLYSVTPIAVLADGNRVLGVVIFDGKKETVIGARVVIDGAEGIVCSLLGLPFLRGRLTDGKGARFSMTVAVAEGERVHGSYIFCENTGKESPTEAAKTVYRWASTNPAMQKSYHEGNRLFGLGCTVGRREVPRVLTEEVVSFRDRLVGKQTEKPLFYSFAPLDNANPDLWAEDAEFQDWQVLCGLHTCGISTGIPVGALIPKDTDGLLVTGKHIGCDHVMTSAVRMRSDMEKCGEATGVLAALTVQSKLSTRETAKQSLDTLRDILRASGCLSDENNIGIGDLNAPNGAMWRSVALPQTTEELKASLSSDFPSYGLLAVRMGCFSDGTDILAEWTETEEGLLQENSAIALGLLSDRRALPVLREILSRPVSVVVHHHDRSYFFPWLYETECVNCIKAACLLGRLGNQADIPLLRTVAEAPHDELSEVLRARLKGFACTSVLQLESGNS